MKTQNSFSHLTLEERRIILTGIINGSTKTAIAQTIGKDKPIGFLQAIPNLEFQRKPLTATSKTVFFKKLPGLPL